MRLLAVGAAGRTGRLLVEQALGHGHDVTALVNSTELPVEHPRLSIVRADALDFDAVSDAMKGHTAVAVTIGRTTRSKPNLHENVVANVVHAMAVHGASRLSVLSAAGAFARSDPNLSLGFRVQIATTLKPLYDDLENMERRVMASALDWTIVRPVGLSSDSPTGHYRVAPTGSIPTKPSRVSRSDVAAVLLKSLETQIYVRKTIVVAG